MAPFDPSLLRALPGARGRVARLAGMGVVSGALALGQAVTVAWAATAIVRAAPLRTPLIVLAASFPTVDAPSQAVLHLRCLRAVFKLAAATLISASRNPDSIPPARFTRS